MCAARQIKIRINEQRRKKQKKYAVYYFALVHIVLFLFLHAINVFTKEKECIAVARTMVLYCEVSEGCEKDREL